MDPWITPHPEGTSSSTSHDGPRWPSAERTCEVASPPCSLALAPCSALGNSRFQTGLGTSGSGASNTFAPLRRRIARTVLVVASSQVAFAQTSGPTNAPAQNGRSPRQGFKPNADDEGGPEAPP